MPTYVISLFVFVQLCMCCGVYTLACTYKQIKQGKNSCAYICWVHCLTKVHPHIRTYDCHLRRCCIYAHEPYIDACLSLRTYVRRLVQEIINARPTIDQTGDRMEFSTVKLMARVPYVTMDSSCLLASYLRLPRRRRRVWRHASRPSIQLNSLWKKTLCRFTGVVYIVGNDGQLDMGRPAVIRIKGHVRVHILIQFNGYLNFKSIIELVHGIVIQEII